MAFKKKQRGRVLSSRNADAGFLAHFTEKEFMSSFREKMELSFLERLPSACRMRMRDEAGKHAKKHNKQQK